MAGEKLELAAWYDSAFLIKRDLENMSACNIPLVTFTDSKQLFDVLKRAKSTTERRLMSDIAAAREAYNDKVESNIGFIRSDYKIADSLTKLDGNVVLMRFLRMFQLDHLVEQYIIKNEHAYTLGNRKNGSKTRKEILSKRKVQY